MPSADPRIIYIILVLPTLFGITLLAEGMNKLIHEELWGLISIFFGFVFLIMVGVVYYIFTSHISL
jgi:hypothetical protein